MKTALIYPYRKKNFTGCNPPLSLLYLAASLQQAGEDVIVIDVDERKMGQAGIIKRLVDYSPHLIGIPLFTFTRRDTYQFLELLNSNNPSWKILIGGPHATVRPQEVLEQFKYCDFVLRGESENSIVELVKGLQHKDQLNLIKGLSYREGDQILHNPNIDLNMNLDSIPFPARDLLKTAYKKNTYWRIGHRGTTDVIITSRGCPYNCHFCYRMSKKFRTRSAENIIKELIDIRSRGIFSVHIMDDLFVWNKPKLFQIIDMIKKEKLNMKFKVRARANFIDEEMLKALKEIGVVSIVYGIESGSQKVLDAMNKRTTVEMNYKAIELTKKAGIQCYADLFIGYPGETQETLQQTERLLLKAKPTAVNMSVLYPLPGTNVYLEAKKLGTLRNDWDINGSIAWIKLPWTNHFGDLYAYKKKIIRKYLFNPVVFFNSLKVILSDIDLRQLRILIHYFLTVLSQRFF